MIPAATLFRFPRYQDRDVYLAQTGQIAPAFDKTKRPKLWSDTRQIPIGPGDVISYKRLPARGESLVLQSFQMIGADAATVNIPGLPHYPAYVIAPTSARILLSGQVSSGFALEAELSTIQQAAQLQKEIGGDDIEIDGTLPIDYTGEARRRWVVRKGTALLNIGLLLEQKYTGGLTSTQGTAGSNVAMGVGSPGHWDLSSVQPRWVPDLIDLGALSNDLPELDPPCRDLHPGESLIWGLAGLEIQTVDQPAGPSQLPENFQARFAALESAVADVGTRLKKLGI